MTSVKNKRLVSFYKSWWQGKFRQILMKTHASYFKMYKWKGVAQTFIDSVFMAQYGRLLKPKLNPLKWTENVKQCKNEVTC